MAVARLALGGGHAMLHGEEIPRGCRPDVGSVTHAFASLWLVMWLCGATLAAPGVRVTRARSLRAAAVGKRVGKAPRAHPRQERRRVPASRRRVQSRARAGPGGPRNARPLPRCGTRSACPIHGLEPDRRAVTVDPLAHRRLVAAEVAHCACEPSVGGSRRQDEAAAGKGSIELPEQHCRGVVVQSRRTRPRGPVQAPVHGPRWQGHECHWGPATR